MSDRSKEDIHNFICDVEQKLLAQDQSDIPLKHYFANGVYAREIEIPAGTLLTGKIHKFEGINIISKGEITVLSVDGVKRIKAPYTFVSSPGCKRLGFTHSDTVWTCLHGTHETDLVKIECEQIAKDLSEVPQMINQAEAKVCLG